MSTGYSLSVAVFDLLRKAPDSFAAAVRGHQVNAAVVNMEDEPQHPPCAANKGMTFTSRRRTLQHLEDARSSQQHQTRRFKYQGRVDEIEAAPNGATAMPLTCAICDEEKPSSAMAASINDFKVCEDCTVESYGPQFRAAIDDESKWPVRWCGSRVLSPKDFPGTFAASFNDLYARKEAEYSVNRIRRVYCKYEGRALEGNGSKWPSERGDVQKSRAENVKACGNFLGELGIHAEPFLCSTCDGMTCEACGAPVSMLSAHDCSSAPEISIDTDPLDDLQRGTDYQQCPSCGQVIQLMSGCNAVICEKHVVPVHFCYICGIEVHHDDPDHWTQGRGPCPRFNQPGAANAWQQLAAPQVIFVPELGQEVPVDVLIELWQHRVAEQAAEFLEAQQQLQLLIQRTLHNPDGIFGEDDMAIRSQEAALYRVYAQAMQGFRDYVALGIDPLQGDEAVVVRNMQTRLYRLQGLISLLSVNLSAHTFLRPGDWSRWTPEARELAAAPFRQRHADIQHWIMMMDDEVWQHYPVLEGIFRLYMVTLTLWWS
ncbi:hypothetical protein LTR53_000767 [Teratosphaeriaceae sp. CCFEE 6253]|nr:hypothetical protein LTR53_000767 [Teratosphaeriaceae sp. CCFEE 6253]